MQEKTRQRKITPRCSIIWAVNKEPGLLFSSVLLMYIRYLSMHPLTISLLASASISIPFQSSAQATDLWRFIENALIITIRNKTTHTKAFKLFLYHITFLYTTTYFELLCGLDILFFTPFPLPFFCKTLFPYTFNFHFVCTIVISARMSFFHFDAFNRVFIFL